MCSNKNMDDQMENLSANFSCSFVLDLIDMDAFQLGSGLLGCRYFSVQIGRISIEKVLSSRGNVPGAPFPSASIFFGQ
jgi:hypothetical protein